MSRKIKDINPNYFYVVYDDDSYYVIKNVTSLCYVAYDHNCELVNTMNNWDAEHFINSNIKDGCKLKIFKDIKSYGEFMIKLVAMRELVS